MGHMIKRIGLICVAIAVTSMAAASAAQASELHAATSTNASIFGQQTVLHEFKTDSGTVKCTSALFEGTAQGSAGQQQTTAQEITITPTYTGCTAFGLAATIDMNGCEYTITGSGQPALTATVDIVCTKTAGKVIEITAAAGCVVTVAPQAVGGHLVFTNVAGSPADVNVNVTASEIQYEGHGACPSLPATTHTTGGTYVGAATFQAREDKNAAQATHNKHTYQKLLQTGAAVALTAT